MPKMSQTLPEFPAGSTAHLEAPEALRADGYALRRAAMADLPFLQHLYAETRAAEMRATGWPQALRDRFVADQFALQHGHYVRQYSDADFLILQHRTRAVGRLYLHREATDDLIIDIALLAESRGRGLGSALLRHARQDAVRAGRGLRLHVDLRNDAAHRLYLRLGFCDVGVEGAHRSMRWARGFS